MLYFVDAFCVDNVRYPGFCIESGQFVDLVTSHIPGADEFTRLLTEVAFRIKARCAIVDGLVRDIVVIGHELPRHSTAEQSTSFEDSRRLCAHSKNRESVSSQYFARVVAALRTTGAVVVTNINLFGLGGKAELNDLKVALQPSGILVNVVSTQCTRMWTLGPIDRAVNPIGREKGTDPIK